MIALRKERERAMSDYDNPISKTNLQLKTEHTAHMVAVTSSKYKPPDITRYKTITETWRDTHYTPLSKAAWRHMVPVAT